MPIIKAIGGRVIGIVIVLVIIGGIAFIFRDHITGSASDLKVGDCIDVPSATEFSDVQHRPCGDPHDGEVFALVKYPGDQSATYPITMQLQRFLVEQCGPAFTTYTGQPHDTVGDLDYSMFYPTRSSWGRGDRDVTCYAVKSDESKLTGSVRKAQ